MMRFLTVLLPLLLALWLWVALLVGALHLHGGLASLFLG